MPTNDFLRPPSRPPRCVVLFLPLFPDLVLVCLTFIDHVPHPGHVLLLFLRGKNDPCSLLVYDFWIFLLFVSTLLYLCLVLDLFFFFSVSFLFACAASPSLWFGQGGYSAVSVEVLCTLVFLFERVHIHHPPGFPFHLLPFGSHFHSLRNKVNSVHKRTGEDDEVVGKEERQQG